MSEDFLQILGRGVAVEPVVDAVTKGDEKYGAFQSYVKLSEIRSEEKIVKM